MDTVALMKNLDSKEVKIEEKIVHLREYVYEMLGLDRTSEYYKERGKFLARYVAGFVDRIFELFEDVAYIVFDPLHIINIIQSFVKGIFLHPIQTFKALATVLIKKHTSPYGLGVLTAEALILAISAAAIARVGSLVVEAEEGIVSAESAVGGFEDYEEIFRQIRGNPHEVIHHAKQTINTGKAVGLVANVKHIFGL
jgi:hypothetical protein